MATKYYQINEAMAKSANDANSMSDYREGSATDNYRDYVDRVYEIVDKIARERPRLLEKAKYMADRYSRKLAEYFNAYYRNEASCPSYLISGGANFPVKKKNKQNNRRETLLEQWRYLGNYAQRIRNLLTMPRPILSGDEDAIEMLEEKLADLKDLQEKMKAANRAIRMKDTEKGDEALGDLGFSSEQIKELRKPDSLGRVGFPDYELTNNNANIHRLETRLEELKKTKAAGTTETECEFCRIVENTDLMRIQLIFDGKPDLEVRDILKANGFHWAPSQNAWQRQLTSNGKYAAKRAIEQITAMQSAQEGGN